MSITKIFTLEDLLAQTNTPLATLGIDNLNAAIQAHLDYLNNSVSEQMNLLAEETPDARRIWGGSESYEMKEVDEFGEARTQAPISGVELGFPLRKFSVSTGWSYEWYQRAMAAELAKKTIGAQTAYQTALQNEILFAIFNKDNYTFKDRLVDSTSLSVKAFLNADSSTIPDAPNGDTFVGASHTHYNGTSGASLAYGDIDTLISNVQEHGNMRGIMLFVDPAMVSTLVGLTGTKFVKLTVANIIPANTADATLIRDSVDSDPSNKLAGYWNGFPVVVKSWVPTGYIACLATGAAEKPLVYRVDKNASLRGLLAVVEFGAPVITAKVWRSYFGVAVWNRAAGAVLDTAHQSSYTEPILVR